MKTQSKKNKGRKFQQLIRDKIKEVFGLSGNDVRSTSMGAGGEDILLSDKAKGLFPYSIEAKALERFAIYKHYDQAKEHARKNKDTPLLFIKGNYREPLVILNINDFFDILTNSKVLDDE